MSLVVIATNCSAIHHLNKLTLTKNTQFLSIFPIFYFFLTCVKRSQNLKHETNRMSKSKSAQTETIVAMPRRDYSQTREIDMNNSFHVFT